MTPRSACVSLRRFRRVLAWTRRAVWLMALPMTPWASRITGPACRATRSCMRRALLADWLCCQIAMGVIVAFTDPGDGEPLRHAVRRLAGAA
jgi:hypothetical protein